MNEYPYIRTDILEDRNTYFFSKYGGGEFLSAWRRSRAVVLDAAPCEEGEFSYFDGTILAMPSPNENGLYRVVDLFSYVRNTLLADDRSSLPILDRLMQRFEVAKRIFEHYDSNLSAKGRQDYHDLKHYVAFALLLGQAANLTSDPKYINTLLKVNDILCGVCRQLTANEFFATKTSLETEFTLVREVISKKNIRWNPQS